MERNYYSRYEVVETSPPEKAEPNTSLQRIVGSIFKNTPIDDLILIAVIFILITDEQPDIITILALLYIFLV